MNLKEFSKVVKEIIRNQISNETFHFVKGLPEGKTNMRFGFIREGKLVKILSPLRSIPIAYDVANKILPQKDYTLSLRISSEGKTRLISKTGHGSMSVDELKKDILLGAQAERIFYEILTTEDFEITYSEYEGTIIKLNDESHAKQFLQIMIGLFPFVETKPESKKVEINCAFEIEKYDTYKKEQKKRGNLKCRIKVDDQSLGTKIGSFIF